MHTQENIHDNTLKNAKQYARKFSKAKYERWDLLDHEPLDIVLIFLLKFLWSIVRQDRVANCLVCYCLPFARLNTSYDWIQPEWQHTQGKRVYLYLNIWAKQSQCFPKLNKPSKFISISTKIDEQSEWPSAVDLYKLNEWRGWYFFGFGWLVNNSHTDPLHHFTWLNRYQIRPTPY